MQENFFKHLEQLARLTAKLSAHEAARNHKVHVHQTHLTFGSAAILQVNRSNVTSLQF